jgi:uncharacterized membrane protein
MMMTSPLQEKPNAEPVFKMSASVVIDGHYAPPPEDKDGKIWVRTSALIQKTAAALYELWRDVESAPTWQEDITSVTRTGERTSHWVMKFGDKTIKWESQILADEPGKRIAWRSIGGESENAGEVVFEETSSGQCTMVTVLQEFRMGKLASMWETIVGRSPKQAIIENLRHFKALAETGEIPRTQGQPHGPRGMIGHVKESLYGENVLTPAGADLKAS